MVVCEVMDEEVYEGTEEMTNDADAAVKLLQHNLELIKKSAEARNRPNLCLLYTSPSPRDGLLSRMPSSA